MIKFYGNFKLVVITDLSSFSPVTAKHLRLYSELVARV